MTAPAHRRRDAAAAADPAHHEAHIIWVPEARPYTLPHRARLEEGCARAGLRGVQPSDAEDGAAAWLQSRYDARLRAQRREEWRQLSRQLRKRGTR
jgi:hypothetical protein